jgi:hypothetical protein
LLLPSHDEVPFSYFYSMVLPLELSTVMRVLKSMQDGDVFTHYDEATHTRWSS